MTGLSVVVMMGVRCGGGGCRCDRSVLMATRVLLIIPPLTQLNTPYPATAYLTGFLKSRGYAMGQDSVSAESGRVGEIRQDSVSAESGRAGEISQDSSVPTESA